MSVSAAAIVASIVPAAPAMAQVRATVDASARAIAASHPVDTSGESGALAIGVQIDPSIYYEGNEGTTALLRGTASIDQYTGDLGAASSFSVNATAQHRLNSRTTIGVAASAMSSRSAVRDFLSNPGYYGGGAPILPIPLGNVSGGDDAPFRSPDATGVGVLLPDYLEANAGRTTTYGFNGSVTRLLTERDSLSLTAGTTWSNSDAVTAADYRTEAFSLAYDRRLSERVSLRAYVNAGLANYSGWGSLFKSSDSRFVTPTLGLAFRLSETVSGSASAGVSVTGIKEAQGLVRTTTGFAGSIDICQRQYRGSLCATASRGAQPTAYAGVTTVTSVNFGYSRVVGEKGNVSLSAAYSHRAPSQIAAFAGAVEPGSVFAASASYSRKIARRLSAFVNPGYSRTTGSANGERNNFQVSVGIKVRLSDTND